MKTYLKLDARTLRRRGYSFAMLSEQFGISKSTASLWTRDVELSPLGVERLNKRKEQGTLVASQISHQKRLDRLEKASLEASELFSHTDNKSLIVLAALYQGEGAKTGTSLRFTNSDADTVKLFLSVLRSSFKLDESKFRALVHVHDYHNEPEIKDYWSVLTRIPLAQFNRSFKKHSEHKFMKEGYKGCVHIYYHDAHILRVVQSFAKELFKLYI